jgi:hypothetical protein
MRDVLETIAVERIEEALGARSRTGKAPAGAH